MIKMKQIALIIFLLSSISATAAEYALVDQANAILERRDFAATPNDPTGKGWRWLPVVITKPAFDPTTQVQTGPVITVEASRVTAVWTVRNKTAQELDDEKTERVNAVDFLTFEVAFDHENRIRALEAKAAITRAQFKAALKARLP